MIATYGRDVKIFGPTMLTLSKKRAFLTSDLVLVESNKILNIFIVGNFPTLAHKPKILLFDCCRGERGG